MKTRHLVVFIFLLIVMLAATDEAQADYDPDSYGYVMVFAGATTGNTWIDSVPMSNGFGAGYVQRVYQSDFFVSGRYEHTSQLLAGTPFNDIQESWIDHFGVTVEYRF